MEVQLGNCYSQHGWQLATTIIENPMSYQSRPRLRILALRYLLKFRNLILTWKMNHIPSEEYLLEIGIGMIQDFYNQQYHREANQLMTILTHVYGNQVMNLLSSIRYAQVTAVVRHNERNNIYNEPKKKDTKSVYEDKQNVHNHAINQSVIRSSETLIKQACNFLGYKDLTELDTIRKDMIYNIRSVLQSLCKDHETILQTIDYITKNTATFGNVIRFTLSDLLIAVWLFITQHSDKNQLLNRLIEELQEMKGQCTTGHLSRLINVIQGFTINSELSITISNKDQIFSVVKMYLDKVLSECKEDDILEGILEPNDKYIKFIRKNIAYKLLEWEAEYGNEGIQYISDIVNQYTNTEIFQK